MCCNNRARTHIIVPSTILEVSERFANSATRLNYLRRARLQESSINITNARRQEEAAITVV